MQGLAQNKPAGLFCARPVYVVGGGGGNFMNLRFFLIAVLEALVVFCCFAVFLIPLLFMLPPGL